MVLRSCRDHGVKSLTSWHMGNCTCCISQVTQSCITCMYMTYARSRSACMHTQLKQTHTHRVFQSKILLGCRHISRSNSHVSLLHITTFDLCICMYMYVDVPYTAPFHLESQLPAWHSNIAVWRGRGGGEGRRGGRVVGREGGEWWEGRRR